MSRVEPSPAIAGARLRQACVAALDAALEFAASHATCPHEARAEHLRRVRRSTKRLRALLPLLEGAFAPEAIDGLERLLREASALLAPIRDRDAMLHTVRRLFDGRSGPHVEHAAAILSRVVTSGADPRGDRALEDLIVAKAADSLRAVRDACLCIDPDRIRPQHVAETIAAGWREIRRRARPGWEARDIELVHDVRKRCSRLALQCAPFATIAPKPVRSLRRRMRALAGALGDERDLSMLTERIAVHAIVGTDAPFVAEVLDVSRRIRSRLRNEAAEALRPALRVRPRALRRELLRAIG